MTFLFSVFRTIRFAVKVVRFLSLGIAIVHGARRYAS